MISYETVLAYCIKKLAEQIRTCSYKTLLSDPESIVDKAVAEVHIKSRAYLVKEITGELADKNPADYSYADFDRDYGRFIWDNYYQWISRIIDRPIYEVHFR